MGSKHESAHHIEEFGSAKVVHVEKSAEHSPSESSDSLPKQLFRHHRLKQYFIGETLYRTSELRKVTKDELFLDLIIVANIAAIGHELRANFKGWNEIEKFLLLFGAVYSVWRGLTIYWNLWESHQDVYNKLFVYAVFTMLTGIGIGAHGAFGECLPWVAGASFIGNVIPWGLSAYHSMREELLKGDDNIINNGLLMSVVQSIGALPYFAACFVNSPRAARILFWIPPIFQAFSFFISMKVFQYFHKDRPNRRAIGISIELLAEKFEVFTLIVLGESLLAILFEAADFIATPDARINLTFGCVFGTTAIVTAFATFYMNIDNKIIHGSKHAIRHNAVLGLVWNTTHFPFHACLILFSTGLGIAFRDIIIEPGAAGTATEVVAHATVAAVRATEPGHAVIEAPSGPQFGDAQLFLFLIGWGGALVLSGAISLCHSYGPREFTKPLRLFVRFAIAIGLSVGLPFAKLPAELLILITALTTSAMCIIEYIFVHADNLNLFRSKDKGNVDSSSGDEELGSEYELKAKNSTKSR